SVILHRPNYQTLRASIVRRVQNHDDVPGLMDDVCQQLAHAMSARHVTWRESDAPRNEETAGIVFSANGAATVVVPTSVGPRYVLPLCEVRGCLRFLSDDLYALESVAMVLARRVDAIRITHERCQRELREQEIAKLATEAELRALRAQINPHFLFNALTTI